MNLISITIEQTGSGILGDIISGLVIALVVLGLSVIRERKQQQDQNKAFFIEQAVDNTYYLNLLTLNDNLDKYKYADTLKEYKKLTTLLSLLLNCPVKEVSYFDFLEKETIIDEKTHEIKETNYKYTLNKEKYNFVISSLKNLGLM